MAFVVFVAGSPTANAELPSNFWTNFGGEESQDGNWEKLEDGNYGFVDKGKVIDEYSAEDAARVDNIINEVVDKSGYDISVPEVSKDASFLDKERAAEILEKIRNGEVYTSDGSATVGEEVSSLARYMGELPSLGDIAGAAGQAAIAVGAAYVGVKIGDGIDELIGIPTLEEAISPSGSQETVSARQEWNFRYDKQIETEEGGFCTKYKGSIDLGIEGACIPAYQKFTTEEWEESPVESGEVNLRETFTFQGNFSRPHKYEEISGFPEIASPPSLSKEIIGSTEYTFLRSKTADCWKNHFPHLQSYGNCAFPGTIELPATVSPDELSPKTKTTPGSKKFKATEVPGPLPAYILHEVTEIHPKTGTTPHNPTFPELPAPEPSEVATHYATRVEERGFTNVHIHTLAETAIDPHVGPNEVASVLPNPGTRDAPSVEVRIEANPDNAPVPAEGGGGLGPPSLPGFHIPNFGVLCKGFPFGVPCWLAETIGSWSATPVAPELGIEEFTIGGHKIKGSKFQLYHLEPIMEKVRPAMVIFATIGIVLLFYRFAKGGGPPSGGGSDSPGESFAENDAYYNTENRD